MNGNNLISQFIHFVIYLALQVLLVRNLVLFDKAFCFVYLGFLLLLPLEIGHIAIMLIAFLSGLTVDMFYDSMGMHASAAVLITFLRPYYLNLLMPKGGYDAVDVPSIHKMGLNWFASYTIPLIFMYLFTLFFLEAGGFGMFWFTMTKVALSTILTFLVLTLIQYFFYSSRRSSI